MPDATVNGIRLHYNEVGSGDPLLGDKDTDAKYGRNGGIIIAPTHELGRDIPPENLLVMMASDASSASALFDRLVETMQTEGPHRPLLSQRVADRASHQGDTQNLVLAFNLSHGAFAPRRA